LLALLPDFMELALINLLSMSVTTMSRLVLNPQERAEVNVHDLDTNMGYQGEFGQVSTLRFADVGRYEILAEFVSGDKPGPSTHKVSDWLSRVIS